MLLSAFHRHRSQGLEELTIFLKNGLNPESWNWSRGSPRGPSSVCVFSLEMWVPSKGVKLRRCLVNLLPPHSLPCKIWWLKAFANVTVSLWANHNALAELIFPEAGEHHSEKEQNSQAIDLRGTFFIGLCADLKKLGFSELLNAVFVPCSWHFALQSRKIM